MHRDYIMANMTHKTRNLLRAPGKTCLFISRVRNSMLDIVRYITQSALTSWKAKYRENASRSLALRVSAILTYRSYQIFRFFGKFF